MTSVVFLLLAAAIAVPLFKKFGLGSILGYLAAGVVLGPTFLHVIEDPEKVLHFSEIGVILLLFVIGLELEPAKLWQMKNRVLGLGFGQLGITALAVYAVLSGVFGVDSTTSLIVALALGLSSTAFAIQLMADKGILGTQDGRNGFSILLFQDLAVVPILFIVQAVAPAGEQQQVVPWWLAPTAVLALIASARYLINPALSFMARYGGREIMTVVALLIVLGAAELMILAGLSAGMGAFMAGMMLANSTFRHQLEVDIEPFKGLSLGLFFISIGMTLNLGLLLTSPLIILAGTVGLMLVKALIIGGLVRLTGSPFSHGVPLGFMLAQGGEFAFVITAQAIASGGMATEDASLVNLIVGLSMAATGPVVNWVETRFEKREEAREKSADTNFEHKEPEVIILGFGRFGQIVARMLSAHQIPFTAIDRDAAHISFVQRLGNKVYYGDPAREEILESAGLAKARAVVIGIDISADVQKIAAYIQANYPKVQIIARAHNRMDYMAMKRKGIDRSVRELFPSGLEAAVHTLVALGFSDSQALEAAKVFREHDERVLEAQSHNMDDEEKMIQQDVDGRSQLEAVFKADREHS